MYSASRQLELLKRSLTGIGIEIPDEILEDELIFARDVINERRRYKPTQEAPLEPQYFSLQIRLAKSAVLRRGIEGEREHTEGDVKLVYSSGSVYDPVELRMVIPLARSL